MLGWSFLPCITSQISEKFSCAKALSLWKYEEVTLGTMAEIEVVRIKEVSGLPVAALRGTQYSLLQLIRSYFISAHGRAFSFSHPRRSTGQEFFASSSTERSREIKELPKSHTTFC